MPPPQDPPPLSEQSTVLPGIEPIPDRHPGPAAFRDGEVVAGRYRVLGRVAAGGMGEVYRAFDLELNDVVALKTIREEVASRPGALDRFKQEIRLARRVTHPNVCRVFDLEQIDRPGGGTVLFLTMELLAGETLSARLHREGALPPGEVLRLGREMARALHAAHQAGVVHRDFKCANVILVPTPVPGDPPRPVISDFGLAVLEQESRATPGRAIGTPRYMAPEQLSGGRVDARADIYAFGVVLFEMLTARPPFQGADPMETALLRLKEAPPAPSQVRRGLESRWDRVVLRCLEREPARRYASAEELLDALGAGRSRPTRRSRLLWAGIALLLLGAGAMAAELARRALLVPAPLRPAVAVLTPVVDGQDAAQAWVGTALGELLTNEIAAAPGLRAVPADTVARVAAELGPGPGQPLAEPSLPAAARYLGADWLVQSRWRPGNPARLEVTLRRGGDLDPVASFAEAGSRDELAALATRMGARLRQALGSGPAEPVETARASLPRDPRAAQAYAEGLSRLRAFDPAGARAALEDAVTREPAFALGHAALADAWAALGREDAAAAAMKTAFERALTLPRAERIWVEAGHRERSNEWDRAIDLLRALWSFYPDHLEYGLRLAEAEISGGRTAEALQRIAALRRLPGTQAEDPRIDLAEARAARWVGDHQLALQAAGRAAAKGRARGARLIEARARLFEAGVHVERAEYDPAIAAARDAARLSEAAGDLASAARAETHVAVALERLGRTEEARISAERALAGLEAAGNRTSAANQLIHLGRLQLDLGETAAAERSLIEAGERLEAGSARNLPGLLERGWGLHWLVQAQPARARAAFERSSALLAGASIRSEEAITPVLVAHSYLAEGKLAEARREASHALAAARRLGSRLEGAQASLLLGRIELRASNAEAALAHLEEAAAGFAAAGMRPILAWIAALRAEALARSGRAAEAAGAAREAELALARGLPYRLEAHTRLALYRGDPRRAAERAALASEAERRGQLDLAAWARARD